MKLHVWSFLLIIAFIVISRLLWALTISPGFFPLVPTYVAPPPPTAKPDLTSHPTQVATAAALNYHAGPLDLGSGTFRIPAGLRWVDKAGAVFACAQMGTHTGLTIEAMLLPASERLDGSYDDLALWGMAVSTMPYHLDDRPYADVDSAVLLESLVAANHWNGNPPIVLLGWAQPPHFDAHRHLLTWAKRFRVGGREVTSFALRLFLRHETLLLDSIGAPQHLEVYQAVAAQFSSGFTVNPGQDAASAQRDDGENLLDPAMIFAEDGDSGTLKMSGASPLLLPAILVMVGTLVGMWWFRQSLLQRFGGLAAPLPPVPPPITGRQPAAGAFPCPRCRQLLANDAAKCVNCGYALRL